MIPKIPSRIDAFVLCPCSGTAGIATVAPIPEDPDHMRHLYTCLDCGKDLSFDVAKNGVEARDAQKREA
ncbi:MAG: hypothetical protein Q8M24_10810 [Pseudolabrys sp.]|nr:hypothetical protein [Pseudolabrys sp.]MDP2295938.1 hypothetical protein [Pseudolabrys sp.]